MFQKLHFVCLFIVLFIGAQAQIITTNPALPVASQAVTITFNSAESTGLGYYTGDLYAHTGVTIEGKANGKM